MFFLVFAFSLFLSREKRWALILKTALGETYYYLYFPDKKMEILRSEVICPRPHS